MLRSPSVAQELIDRPPPDQGSIITDPLLVETAEAFSRSALGCGADETHPQPGSSAGGGHGAGPSAASSCFVRKRTVDLSKVGVVACWCALFTGVVCYFVLVVVLSRFFLVGWESWAIFLFHFCVTLQL